jgi:Predicted phosphohydrolases
MRKLFITDRANTPSGLDKFIIGQDSIITGSIEALMNNGRFIIVDVNDINIVIMQTLILYVARYRYKVYCLEDISDNFFLKLPPEGFLNIIKHEDELEDQIVDLSGYKQVVHIGDIHGSYDVLMEAWKKIYSPHFFYIFLGDLVDRGKKSDKVVEFLLSLYQLPNVMIIEGNHDTNLWNWAIDSYEYLAKSFKDTRSQLKRSNISKDDVKKLCISMRENAVYKYNEKTVMVSHGGLHQYPEKRYLIDTADYISSQCNDYAELDKMFTEKVQEGQNLYQLHGHSNFFSIKSNAHKNSFNLEGGVELGGSLRVATVSNNGFWFYYFKNNDSIMQNFFRLNNTKS